VFVHISAVEKAGYIGLAEGAKVTFDVRPEPWQGIGRKFEDPLSGYPVAGQPFGPRSHRRCRPQAHRFNPACFSFGFGGLLLLLLLRLALGRRWRSRPTKSGGPPPLEPSLKVQGDDTHNNSGFSVI